MKILLCMVVIAVAASQVAGQTVLQTFSTEPQTFTSPGETLSVPAETRTFEIPGQSVTIPQRTVTIPGRNYRLIEMASTCVPQTQVCGPGGCGPDAGLGVSVDVNAGGRGLFRREGRRAGRRTGRRFFRRNQ